MRSDWAGFCYRPFQDGVHCDVLNLCGFMVFTTRHFVLSLALCYFQSCIALWSHRLWKREMVYMLLVHFLFIFVCVAFFVSPCCCHGLAAACECGTPWTFPLNFFIIIYRWSMICTYSSTSCVRLWKQFPANVVSALSSRWLKLNIEHEMF